MNKSIIMTPGPTAVHESVRNALAQPITNPDLDEKFYEFYKETCEKFKQLLNTNNDVLILSGEGILGLEAACASLIEPGDRVLCLDNGIFGNGFGDFAKMYGADVIMFKGDYQRGINIDELKIFLEKDHQFKVATLVHCETPSGITNPIDLICPLLNSYGIITVVDSVSAIGGESLMTDEWKVDIALGGSQKCLSAPPGLTFLSISNIAWDKILNRKTPIIGYYANLSHWKNWYQDKWFPYTQPISDIFGLGVAIDNWLAEANPIGRHAKMAEATRKSLMEAGLSLYPLDSYSNTVTTVMVPEGISFKTLYDEMFMEHNIMIGGAFGYLKDKVFRIGHMGENCYEDKLYFTLRALSKVLNKYNIPLKGDLHQIFLQEVE